MKSGSPVRLMRVWARVSPRQFEHVTHAHDVSISRTVTSPDQPVGHGRQRDPGVGGTLGRTRPCPSTGAVTRLHFGRWAGAFLRLPSNADVRHGDLQRFRRELAERSRPSTRRAYSCGRRRGLEKFTVGLVADQQWARVRQVLPLSAPTLDDHAQENLRAARSRFR